MNNRQSGRVAIKATGNEKIDRVARTNRKGSQGIHDYGVYSVLCTLSFASPLRVFLTIAKGNFRVGERYEAGSQLVGLGGNI